MVNQSSITSIIAGAGTKNELEHYGRLGMKWGRHIFGEKISGPKKIYTFKDKKTGKKYRLAVPKSKNYSKEQIQAMGKRLIAKEQKKQEKARREKILQDPKKLYKHRREFSKEEIDAAMKNFEWEKKLRELSVADVRHGKEMINETVGYVNALIGGYNTAVGISNALYPENNLPTILVNAPKKKDDKKK